MKYDGETIVENYGRCKHIFSSIHTWPYCKKLSKRCWKTDDWREKKCSYFERRQG